MRVKIVSGTDNPLLRSDQNHQAYAARHGYDYVFDTAIYDGLPSPHFRKLLSVLNALDDADWVFWLDDDAYFTQLNVPLETFLTGVGDDVFLVLCSSPVNPSGRWTFINSGVFFIRNDARSRTFLHRVLETPVETARAWWDATRFGMFTNGDQDSMVYVLSNNDLLHCAMILPYQAFNARPYHFKERLDEFFLVHFPGVPDKGAAVAQFGARFGSDAALLPSRPNVTRPWAFSLKEYVSLIRRWLVRLRGHSPGRG